MLRGDDRPDSIGLKMRCELVERPSRTSVPMDSAVSMVPRHVHLSGSLEALEQAPHSILLGTYIRILEYTRI